MADNPNFRYVVGKYAATLLEAKEIHQIENFKTYSRNSLICRIL